AELRRVARPGRGATLRARAREAVGRAVVVHAVAALGDVADIGRGAADRRALGVHRTVGREPGARLGQVADAGGGAADDPGRREQIRRAGGVEPRARVVEVA